MVLSVLAGDGRRQGPQLEPGHPLGKRSEGSSAGGRGAERLPGAHHMLEPSSGSLMRVQQTQVLPLAQVADWVSVFGAQPRRVGGLLMAVLGG